MTKMTREEKLAAARAETRTKRIAEFRQMFARQTGRRLYTAAAAWQANETGDLTGTMLYEMVSEFTRVRERLAREVKSCAEALVEMVARIGNNRASMSWSNGVCGRYGIEIDQFEAQAEALRNAIKVAAYSTGWRVREIEDANEQAVNDRNAQIDVVAGAGRWWVRKTDAAGVETFFFSGTEFVEAALGMSFATEDDAYEALAVLVTGRTLSTI